MVLTHTLTARAASPPPADAPPAVEIATVLDDTVVAVHHLSGTDGGRLSLATRALAGSALIGLGAFIAVAVGVGGIVAENRRAEERFLAEGGASIDFRPRRVPPLADLAAALALGSGLGSAAWALGRAQRERRPVRFRAGRGPGVDLPTEALPPGLQTLDLVAPVQGGFAFTPAPDMTGVITEGGVERPLAPVALVRGVRVRAVLGGVTLVISPVVAPRPTGPAGPLDRRVLGYGAASAVAHALLVGLVLLVPAQARGLADDPLTSGVRLTKAVFKPHEEPVPLATGPAAPGAAPAGAETRAPAAPPAGPTTRPPRHAAGGPPAPAAPLDPRRAGILAILAAGPGPDVTLGPTLPGVDGLDGGSGALALNGSGGPGFGPGGPSGPMGPGGGEPWGLIPAGDGSPGFRLPTSPPVRLSPRRPRPIIDLTGPALPTAHVDPALIRRAIRAHRAELSYCYERELVVQPTLVGTVTAELLIGADGRVSLARAHGLAPAVDACVADVLRAISFPAGEVIHVTSYPFTFRPAGS